MIKLILPTKGVLLDLKKGEHLYFLAGPVLENNDWQAKAIRILSEKDPGCYIACPCIYEQKHPLYKYKVTSTEFPTFNSKNRWIKYYMEQASYFGCVIFWLPCSINKNKESYSFSPDIYSDVARWSIKGSLPNLFSLHKNMNASNYFRVNVVFGAEKNFPGLCGIKDNLNTDYKGIFHICNSLEMTILEALKLAKKIDT